LQQASEYVVSYAHESPSEAEKWEREQRALSTAGLWLRLRFDENILVNVLRAQGQPVWGNTRPVVLVWLGVETAGGQRFVLGAQGGVDHSDAGYAVTDRDDATRGVRGAAVSALRHAASARGLPMTLPILDQEDVNQGAEVGVFGFITDTMMLASRRYNPDVVVLGRVRQVSPDQWRGEWRLEVNGESYRFDDQAVTVANLSERAINRVAEQLSALYSVVRDVDSIGRVSVRVVDVKDFVTYQGVQQYLQRLNVVKKVQLQRVEGDHLLYSIDLDGSVEQFKKSIALDNRLIPREARGAEGVETAWSVEPEYREPHSEWQSEAQGELQSELDRESPTRIGDDTASLERLPRVLEYYWVGPQGR
ncbi:MAG: DUF2066 domain-containing protein, partial [Gammaproteobacteria bacterium]